jgi:nitrogen regulatory protein PII
MLDKVTDALRTKMVSGVTVIECHGFGRQTGGDSPHYEDDAADLGYAPKAKIEIVCSDEEESTIVQTVRESAHTGRHGDGKIYVTEVLRTFDIRA